MRAYYERRAREYDESYEGTGRCADQRRAGWDPELTELAHARRELAPAPDFDVAAVRCE